MSRKNANSIEVMFPIILLVVFVVSAISVVLLAAETYRHIVRSAQENYDTRTAIEYVTEKVRQADASNAVSVGTFDSRNALILEQNLDGSTYRTYLYENNGQLCELYLKDGTAATAASGTAILSLSAFQAQQVSDHLLAITCTDSDGVTASTYIALRSDS